MALTCYETRFRVQGDAKARNARVNMALRNEEMPKGHRAQGLKHSKA